MVCDVEMVCDVLRWCVACGGGVWFFEVVIQKFQHQIYQLYDLIKRKKRKTIPANRAIGI